MKSVFWGNYKGGVGKTTSTFQIAAHFAMNGKRVLLIDLDPQCSLSNICCYDIYTKMDDIEINKTFNYVLELYIREISNNSEFAYQLLTDTVSCRTRNYLANTIRSFNGEWSKGNLSFIPSRMLSNARMNELAQVMNENVFNIFLVKQFLDDLRTIGDENPEYNFDYVFFDCPPTTNMLTQSVFLSSDYYIIPTICDEVSTNGVPDYISEIEKTRDKYSVNDKVRGVLLEHVFPRKSRFVGVFETLYKGRAGSPLNYRLIETLDQNIRKLGDIHSVLSEPKYIDYRYDKTNGTYPDRKPINPQNITTLHVFNGLNSIDHKDARASGESVAKNTAEAKHTDEYRDLAQSIMEMIK